MFHDVDDVLLVDLNIHVDLQTLLWAADLVWVYSGLSVDQLLEGVLFLGHEDLQIVRQLGFFEEVLVESEHGFHAVDGLVELRVVLGPETAHLNRKR